MAASLRTSTGMWLGALLIMVSACSDGGAGDDSGASTGQGGAGQGGAGQGGAGQGGASAVFPEAPCGIFVLGSAKAGFSKSQTRDYPFVDGFVLRMFWTDFSPAADVYDFTDVDAALASVVSLGQKLTLQILGEDPPHVVANAKETWVWHDLNANHTGDCSDEDGCVRPLPWDPAAIAHHAAAVQALAAHVVDTGAGPIALADHPSLAVVHLGLPGWSRIRELFFDVETWPAYTRNKLVQSVTDAIDLDVAAFPHKPVMVGFWDVNDGIAKPAFWEEMNGALLGRYSGTTGSRLGYFQENLRHGVDMGVDSYGPETTYAKPLAAAKDQTFIALQMLTSWTNPFTGADKVEGGTPHKAMAWAHETYGTRYFEIYADDTDTAASSNPAWLDGINGVRQTLGCNP